MRKMKRRIRSNPRRRIRKKSCAKEKKKTPDNEKKKIPTRNGTYTKNIVYKEVLTL